MGSFSQRLLRWFGRHGRHDLPWQQHPTPYRVWVSEVMLQQTQVSTVIPYYLRFMERFTDLVSLANADEDDVLALWSGLGYYSRARNLYCAAQLIRDEYNGVFPSNFEEVVALPGIGRSTAGAILAIACRQHHPILDGNVKRVLSRYHAVEGWPGKREVEQRLWQLAAEHTPQQRVADYTQAIMDLGATLCTRSKPDCEACPVRSDCAACSQGRVTDFPGKKPRKTLPTKSVIMPVVLNDHGEVLLEKRPPTGIWGGLWSLPECADETEFKHWCEQQGHDDRIVVRLDAFRHTFSHYHLMIQPILVQENRTYRAQITESVAQTWKSPADFRVIGLPAAVLKILGSIY
ncbi:MAG: A/G-specific adenine glycosylase [Chromatiales bacterium]|nr:A/G-specific adenine glycosylase [Chromatiales bacterium]